MKMYKHSLSHNVKESEMKLDLNKDEPSSKFHLLSSFCVILLNKQTDKHISSLTEVIIYYNICINK